MFKEKILSTLKTEYSSLGLGDERLSKVADIIDATVEKEEDVETAVKAGWVSGTLKMMQSDNDSARNVKAGLEKQLKELKENGEGNKKTIADLEAKIKELEKKTPTPNPNPNPNPNPKPKEENQPHVYTAEELDKLMNDNFDKRMKAINEANAKKAEEEAKAAAEAKAKEEQALAKFKELGIDDKFKDVALSLSKTAKTAEEYEEQLKSFKQTIADGGFKTATAPESAEVQQAKDNEAIAKMIDDGTKTIVESKK